MGGGGTSHLKLTSHLKMVVPSLIWRWLCPPSPRTVVIERSSGGWGRHHIWTWHHIWRWSSRLSLIWRWLCPPSPGTVVISWSSGGWETSHLKLKLTSHLNCTTNKEDFFEENYLRWPSHHLTSEDLKLTWHHIWRWSSQLSLIWRWLCHHHIWSWSWLDITTALSW